MRTRILTNLLWFALISAGLINLLGALSPELGFDALWYHLTIPKLYLLRGEIYHIPGGLLYYSAMPRLAEFFYIPLLKLLGETGPHLLNFAFGIGTALLLYKLSRKYLDELVSLLVVSLWYVTPLVGWQSGSAYVDLQRTFFEFLAFYLVINKRFVWAGIAAGLAISTKTLALGTVPILALIAWLETKKILSPLTLILIPLLVALPWFLDAYKNTGFPFYPIGAGVLDPTHMINFDFWNLPKEYLKLFIFPDDIISPIYVLFLPFLFLLRKKKPRIFTSLLTYYFLTLFLWFIIPRTGGGRFILPYLPVWALLVGLTITWQKTNLLKLLLISLIVGSVFVNLFYRGAAVSRNLAYLTGWETREEFLCSRLDFSTSVFVDCDGFFQKTIKPTDLVLIKGIHNLFYVNFPFVHETWYNGENYTHILTDKPLVGKVPLYENKTTKVFLYKK